MMKHLLILPLLVFTLVACEKSDPITLDDLRSEAAVWQLDAYMFSAGGPQEAQLLHSERTLQFWDGQVRSNGSFCNLTGPVGALQEIDYDPVNTQFTVGPCLVDTSSYTVTYPYFLDLERGYLNVLLPRCVEGCSYRYRRVEQ